MAITEKQTLIRLIYAAEDYASSDPDMPSHDATEVEFEAALIEAKIIAGLPATKDTEE